MTAATLIAGGYDIGFQQSDHVVRAVESGGDLFAFMAFAHAPELSLIVAPQIASFDALRNGTIVVDGARTGYALLLRKLLADHGLSATDYRMQEFGGSQERQDAMRSGGGIATLLNPPFDRQLVAEGFGHHVPKGYIYFAMAFSFSVELLNIHFRKTRSKPVKLREPNMPGDEGH